ncbi:MAG: helix-turn-helix domain-containing protein, partial [Pseudonocardia sp.]|nr:helix-turn-helix domain-containing protein [Pseudonocardia sp.]
MNHPSSSTEAAATARAQHPLAERRERRGFSVTRLAGEIGASPATVRRWETGEA